MTTYDDLASLIELEKFERSDRRLEWSEITELLPTLPEPEGKPPYNPARTAHLAGTRFNEQADLGEMLTVLAGCTLVRGDSREKHYHYPNAENEQSVTWYVPEDSVTVWSETMARELGLKIRRPYDAFGFLAAVKHKGSFQAAQLRRLEHGHNRQRPLLRSEPQRQRGFQLCLIAPLPLSQLSPPIWLWLKWMVACASSRVTSSHGRERGEPLGWQWWTSRLSTGEPWPDDDVGREPVRCGVVGLLKSRRGGS